MALGIRVYVNAGHMHLGKLPIFAVADRKS